MKSSHKIVLHCGAHSEGMRDDTRAVQNAIDSCFQNGGGTVVLLPSRYRCGTLHLRSNVSLHLEAGAVLQGSAGAALYPVICPTPFGNLPGQIQALLWGKDVENIAVTDEGVIDGGGAEPLSPADAVEVRFRPALVFLEGCRDVRFHDVTLRNSCFWTLHLLRCADVEVHGVSIFANRQRINTDGIDPDGCRNVSIRDCIIETGDDCIVLKSTEGDVCENIVVRNCRLSSTHAALKLGTEAIGDIRDVVFEDCIITDSDVALALYMKDGSTYENICFVDIFAEAWGAFPLLVDITPRDYRAPKIGTIRNVRFENVAMKSAGRALFEGTPEQPIEKLSIRNLNWEITGDCDFQNAHKPAGARRVVLDPDRPNYASEPSQLIIAHARDVEIEGLNLKYSDGYTSRQSLFLHDAPSVRFTQIV
jgi:polygalacturonase